MSQDTQPYHGIISPCRGLHVLTLLPQSSKANACMLCWLDYWTATPAATVRRRPVLGEKPDLPELPDNIAAHKQSSAFSNIEAILSIMAKVSLSRQMSRKYMLHIVLALAGGSKVHLYPGAALLPGRSLVGSNDREKGKAQSQKLGEERSFPFGLIMVMCFSN